MTNTISEDDCPCSDATDPSNVTSLTTENNSSELSGNCAQTADKANNTVNQPIPSIINCKCHEVLTNLLGPLPESSVKKPEDYPLSNPCEPTVPCFCNTHKTRTYSLPVKYSKDDTRSERPCWWRFNWKWPSKDFVKTDKMFEIKFNDNPCPQYAKSYAGSPVPEGIPKNQEYIFADTKPPKYRPESKKKKEDIAERIDIYYFDHGNSAYYRTTDSPPLLATEKCAEKTDQVATRFWAEIFGTIHIGTAFVTAFILQLLRFLLFSIIRPLTVGILQLLADYFIKPCLSIVFNALIQPFLILLYNIATSFKDLCEPLAEAFGLFLGEIANLCRAIRIVEVRQTSNAGPVSCS